MQTLLRAGLFFLVFLVFSPTGGAQCPEGTRNNYKGDCVSVAPLTKDDQRREEQAQKWSESATKSDVAEEVVAEEVVAEEDLKDTSGDSSTESVVIVEEVMAVDEDGSSLVVKEPLPDSSATTDLANALLTIQQLREEIKGLLNRVELQRYEVEKLRGRQRDLYDDLDQRLRKQERLVLTVPVPEMPSVDSIVIASEVLLPAEPAPMMTSVEQPSSSVGSSTEGATGAAVMNVIQDQETSVVSVTLETVETVPAPTPMVTGIDLPVPTADSGAIEIIQPQTHVEVQKWEIQEGSVAAEQLIEETASSVTTVVVQTQETEASESTAEIGTSIADDTQENQLDVEQYSSVEDETASVVPTKVPTEEQSTIVVTNMAPTIVTLGEQDAYDQAFNMLKQSRYEEAAEEFANFLRQYRDSQLTDDAWYWMAEAHYVTGDFERALIGFNTIVSYFVNSPRIPASRLKIGYIQYEMANFSESRETLTELLRDFPAHRVAVSAEARLKKMDRDRQ